MAQVQAQPIPQPPGVPLLGNVLNVDTNNTWDSLRKLAEQYGEIFQLRVLGNTVVFVAGAALAEEVCDEARFRKYVGGPIVEIRYAVHDSLFAAYDYEESWGVAHRIMAPLLSRESVARRFDGVRGTAAELVDKWRAASAATGTRVAILDELNRLSLEATVLTLFGRRLNCIAAEKDHPMLQAMEDSTSEAMKRPTRLPCVNQLLYGGKLKRATRTMRAFAAEVVEHRKQQQAAAAAAAGAGADAAAAAAAAAAEPPPPADDLLAALLAARDPDTGKALTDSQVIDEIVTMPIGSSTAPTLVSAAVYFLLKNPDTMAWARAELLAVVGGAGALTLEHLARLPYLEGVVRESLRLCFAAPGFNREPVPRTTAGGHVDKTPVSLAGGKYQIAHDQAVIVVLAGVNRDPAVFADPLAFRPERMMAGTAAFDGLPESVKKWFGTGKRQCIGRHWAWQWSMAVLAVLISDVDFEMADAAYELHQDGWFNVRPVDFYVKVRPRVR